MSDFQGKLFVFSAPSGSGKTTIGAGLAKALDWPFYDADDYHPKENIEKMANGIPLTDEERLPWLQVLSGLMKIWNNTNAVLACSALKESYRVFLFKEVEELVLTLDQAGTQTQQQIEVRTLHLANPDVVNSALQAILGESVSTSTSSNGGGNNSSSGQSGGSPSSSADAIRQRIQAFQEAARRAAEARGGGGGAPGGGRPGGGFPGGGFPGGGRPGGR